MADVFRIGLGRQNITPEPRGEVLMGWGDPKQRAREIGLPIHARAVVLRTSESFFGLACLEICFITQALRDEVLKRLQERDPRGGWTEDTLCLSATHTHCAPGGHTHDVLYNLPSYGYYPHVFEKYAEGTTQALLDAASSLQEARIRCAEGEFELGTPVAFNRSIQAYNQNPDVQPYSYDDRAQALDRRMRMFRFEDLDGRLIGCMNEFAVHCTSVHRDYNMIHSDNKGVAATQMEQETGCVCIFVQGAAGDSSPNFQRFAGLREVRGTDRDDLESARKNGTYQADMARTLLARAAQAPAVTNELDSAISYVDFSAIHVDLRDVRGRTDAHTGPAVIGARALLGTDEGMPTSKAIFHVAQFISRCADMVEFISSGGKKKFLPGFDPVQGPKQGCIQSGESQIFRARGFENSVVPEFLDPMIGLMKRWAKKKMMARPLTPQILPIQIARVGEWAWITVPAEFTTVSGRRLRASVLEDLAGVAWAKKCLLIGYANSYSGYVTTPEEYQLQLYEGASTHFGQWTQPAYQTAFRSLVARLLQPRSARPQTHLHPPSPTEAELLELRAPPLD